MHARVVHVQVQVGKVDEATKIFRDSVIPAAKQQKGFRSATMLVDAASGKGMAVTLWETEGDLKAGEASGYYQEQLAKFAPIFTAPPTREVFEVAAQS